MATYFQAGKAERVFERYRQLASDYWDAQPPDTRTWMSRDLPREENEASLALRSQLIELFPEANWCARDLRLSVMAESHPPAAVGGPVIPVNLFYAVVDRDKGYRSLSQQEVYDNIERCLAFATATKKRLFWRQLLNPIWWLTEVIAYVLRIPFMILRRAGVPASVEESIWGHVVKVAFFIVLVAISIYFGLDLSGRDILHAIR